MTDSTGKDRPRAPASLVGFLAREGCDISALADEQARPALGLVEHEPAVNRAGEGEPKEAPLTLDGVGGAESFVDNVLYTMMGDPAKMDSVAHARAARHVDVEVGTPDFAANLIASLCAANPTQSDSGATSSARIELLLG